MIPPIAQVQKIQFIRGGKIACRYETLAAFIE